MAFTSILLFFVYTFCLGLITTLFVKNSDNFLERNLMRLGIGLAAFIVIGLVLNLLKIPLDWKIFLFLSIVSAFVYLFFNFKNITTSIKNLRLKITKYDIYILIVLVIFLFTLYMYTKGAFAYPYLEDDDSWSHAVGVKYVAVEKTVFTTQRVIYVDPYPPSYDMILGVLHQTNNSLYWTVKFFNALIISLSIIFFFFFAKEFSDKNKALFSTFALASIPAFASHFIWSISLSFPLIFTAFYATERIKHDKTWIFVASVAIGAALIVAPTHSAYFGLLFAIYYLTKAIMEKSILLNYASAGLLGLAISFFIWWLPTILRRGIKGIVDGIGLGYAVSKVTIQGTGDRIYGMKDFFIAQKENAINNPWGIGLVIILIAILSLIALLFKYRREIAKYKLAIGVVYLVAISLLLTFLFNTYTKGLFSKAVTPGSVPFMEFLSEQLFFISSMLIIVFVFAVLIVVNYKDSNFKDRHVIIILAWLIFSFYAVSAAPYKFQLSPFRAWSIFAIPLALFASEGFYFLIQYSFSYFFIIVGASEILFIFYKSYTDRLNQAAQILYGRILYYNLNWFWTLLLIPIVIGICFLIYYFIKRKVNVPIITIPLILICLIITTSFIPKYIVNTVPWGPGGFWTSNEEIQSYIWMKENLPADSKVFTFLNSAPIIGMDKFICSWCKDLLDYQRNGFNQSADENYNWLKSEGYNYIIIDGQTVKKFKVNETNIKVQSYLQSGKFKPVCCNNGAVVIFQVI